jgi:hypothetical protein
LLSKEPAARFPNTQVLARHLQALVMALTRPAADDFALSHEHLADLQPGAAVDPKLASEATQLDELVGPGSSGLEKAVVSRPGTAPHDAATLAADAASVSQLASKASVSIATAESATPTPIARPTRFTTLEEEEARLRAQQQRPWLLVAVQLATLAIVLAGMVGLAFYLSKAPSADRLYQAVTGGDSEDRPPLSTVETQVNEFLALYPDDPRAGEMERYKNRIELDKLERRLRRESRDGASADPSLLPAEQLYLQAADVAEISPEKATSMLESLINLYGPEPSDSDRDERVSAVVALAKRQLVALRGDVDKLHERQLASLRERLDVANELTRANVKEAADMYQAIIDLHGDDEWAKEIVEAAQKKLAELNP